MKVCSRLSFKIWLRKNAAKLSAAIFWLLIILAYQWFARAQGFTSVQVVQTLLDFLTKSPWGPLIFIFAYAIRPLIFLPATLLTLSGGMIFGPALGVLYVIIASNISSTIAYFVGRFFGGDFLKNESSIELLKSYIHRMRKNSFETVMVMRFIFLPYDAVSYLAGFLRIQYWPFIMATALGSIPGTLAFVGFGASIEKFDGSIPKLDPVTLGLSFAIFIVSLALSRIFKKREGIKND